MRIAQIAPVWERIPPKKYGGTERIIYYLTEELVRRGHEVTLYASGDSITTAKLNSVTPQNLRDTQKKDIYNGLNEYNMLNFAQAYQDQDQFDIIHDHNGPSSLATANISRVPVVYTLHYIAEKETLLWRSLNNPFLVSISKGALKKNWNMQSFATVYHGLKMDDFPFSEKPNGYLLFVGRMHPDKGVHNAIKVAQTLNMKLIIAARYLKTVKVERDYFEKYVKPHLTDPRIKFIGEVDEKTRNHLMSKAICILHPITWPEPFGLTMIEAMACGCPVVAFNKGSIPEIVVNGKTGFVVNSVAQMIQAVKNIDKISRKACREYALETFSVEKMADNYLEVYEKAIEIHKARPYGKSFWFNQKPLEKKIPRGFELPDRPMLYAHNLNPKKIKKF